MDKENRIRTIPEVLADNKSRFEHVDEALKSGAPKNEMAWRKLSFYTALISSTTKFIAFFTNLKKENKNKEE